MLSDQVTRAYKKGAREMKRTEFQSHDHIVDTRQMLREDPELESDEVLGYCVDHAQKVRLDDQKVDVAWLKQVKKFVMEQHYQSLRRLQTYGIKKALEDKAAVKRNYGRLKVKLPDDFKEQVISRRNHNASFAEYRRQIDMKKSTFYNCVYMCIQESEKDNYGKR